MKVELDLNYADGSVEDEVLNRAADLLLRRHLDRTNFRERISNIQDEEIRAAIRPIIDEVLAQPIQRTTNLGAPLGDPVNIRELAVNAIGEVLKPRDRQGRSVLEEVIAQFVNREAHDDFRAAIKLGKKKIEEALQQKGAEILAETIKRATQ